MWVWVGLAIAGTSYVAFMAGRWTSWLPAGLMWFVGFALGYFVLGRFQGERALGMSQVAGGGAILLLGFLASFTT